VAYTARVVDWALIVHFPEKYYFALSTECRKLPLLLYFFDFVKCVIVTSNYSLAVMLKAGLVYIG
jgi:hypothetical protein